MIDFALLESKVIRLLLEGKLRSPGARMKSVPEIFS